MLSNCIRIIICLYFQFCSYNTSFVTAFSDLYRLHRKTSRRPWRGYSGLDNDVLRRTSHVILETFTSSRHIWVPLPPVDCSPTLLHSSRYPRDDNNNKGVGETAAGALLGGVLFGPLGVLLGASVGANVGKTRSMEESKRREMERLGITQDMVDMAQDISMNWQRAKEGYNASQNSLRAQQSLAQRFEMTVQELQDEAKKAIIEGDEDRARAILLKKKQKMDRWKEILLKCAEEKERVDRMEENVQILEQRAREVEALIRRSISAKALQDTSNAMYLLDESAGEISSNSMEDPLLRKFRELEGN